MRGVRRCEKVCECAIEHRSLRLVQAELVALLLKALRLEPRAAGGGGLFATRAAEEEEEEEEGSVVDSEPLRLRSDSIMLESMHACVCK